MEKVKFDAWTMTPGILMLGILAIYTLKTGGNVEIDFKESTIKLDAST